MVQNKLKRLAEVRQQFASLVETLATTGGIVEVTDRGKLVAVMLSYKDYLWLSAQANKPFKPKRQLAGSAVLVGDLDPASKNITESITESATKSALDL